MRKKFPYAVSSMRTFACMTKEEKSFYLKKKQRIGMA